MVAKHGTEGKRDRDLTKERDIHGESNVRSTDRKRSTDLMLILGLSETIEQLAMASSVRWYGHVLRREDGHVLRREDGHVLRRALDFEVKGQRKKS